MNLRAPLCRSSCGFDGVSNKKSYKAVTKRCQKDRDAAEGGNKRVVDCAKSRITQTAVCRRRYCTMIEAVDSKPQILESSDVEDDH